MKTQGRDPRPAFLRLLTNASVLRRYGNPPLTNRQAWKAYETFLADDRIVMRADEPAALEKRWKEFALRDGAAPRLWMDAYLAGFAVAGSLRMVTTDAAFRQFKGLDLELIGRFSTGRDSSPRQ